MEKLISLKKEAKACLKLISPIFDLSDFLEVWGYLPESDGRKSVIGDFLFDWGCREERLRKGRNSLHVEEETGWVW